MKQVATHQTGCAGPSVRPWIAPSAGRFDRSSFSSLLGGGQRSFRFTFSGRIQVLSLGVSKAPSQDSVGELTERSNEQGAAPQQAGEGAAVETTRRGRDPWSHRRTCTACLVCSDLLQRYTPTCRRGGTEGTTRARCDGSRGGVKTNTTLAAVKAGHGGMAHHRRQRGGCAQPAHKRSFKHHR